MFVANESEIRIFALFIIRLSVVLTLNYGASMFPLWNDHVMSSFPITLVSITLISIYIYHIYGLSLIPQNA